MISRSVLVKILFNSLLGFLAIALWLKFVNLSDIKDTLLGVKPAFLIPVFFFSWASVTIRAYRLKVFLHPFLKIKFFEILSLNGVSTMLNFLIPIRAGDISRGVYLAHSYKIPTARTLTWIFLDRFIDFLVLLLLTPVMLLVVPNNLGWQVGVLALGISGILIVTAYLMIFQLNLAKSLLEFCSNLLVFGILKKYFRDFYLHMLESFRILKRSSKDLTYILVITVIAYVTDGLILYFAFLSLGADIPYIKTFLAQFLSALTYLIPAAPGYIGSTEASMLVVFSGILGVDKIVASSMALVYHGSLAIFVISFGIFCLYNLKMSPKELFKKALKR